MAYPIGTGSILSAVWRGSCFNQTVLFTTHWQYDGPLIPDGNAAIAAAAVQFNQLGGISELYQACVPVDLNTIVIDLQWIAPDRYRKRTINSLFTPGSAGACETVNLAGTITATGDVADRHGMGTKHVLMPSAPIIDGEIDGGHRGLLGDLLQGLRGTLPLAAGTLTGVIYGRGTTPVNFTARPITGGSVGDTVRVMRRRTVRVGI